MDASLVSDDLRNTALWRRRCAERFADDRRSAEAAALLDRLAFDVELGDLQGDLDAFEKTLAEIDDDAALRFAELSSQFHREIGFHQFPADGGHYLRSLIDIATEVAR